MTLSFKRPLAKSHQIRRSEYVCTVATENEGTNCWQPDNTTAGCPSRRRV